MNVTVRIAKSFQKDVKPLLKKYPSLSKDLVGLEKELLANPKFGTALGLSAYKIRLKISGKAKGKSGGARVISLVETVVIGNIQMKDEEVTVNLITIYDKAETSSLTDKEIKDRIKAFYQSR